MKTYEFIDSELRKLAILEIENNSSIREQTKLIDVLNSNSIGNEFGGYEAYSSVIKKYGEFSKLRNFSFILEGLGKVDELEIELKDLMEIEERMKYNPKNKIFPFIWISYRVALFQDDEYLDFDFARFLNDIIDKYDYLINLEDFFFETQILLVKPFWESWDKNIFSQPLKKGVSKFPDKPIFKKILAFVYYQNKDYSKAISLLNSILDFIREETGKNGDELIGNFDFPYEDYLDTIQMLGIIHNILGNNQMAMKYVDFTLSNLQKIEVDGELTEDLPGFIDCFFIRMQNNMRLNNSKDVINDYLKVKDYLSWGDWEIEYPEIIEYAEKLTT